MKLAEAMKYSDLTIKSEPIVREQTRTALQLAQELFAEAEDRGHPFEFGMKGWIKKWLPSKRFHLMRVPLNAVALTCHPKGHDLVLKKVYAQEEKPILVDWNKNLVGAAVNGFVPEVVCIDGKHRLNASQIRGNSHIMAWVGEEAIKCMKENERRAKERKR